MKVVIILLLGLVATQQVAALHEDQPNPRGIKDEITNLIEGIMNLIKRTLNQILDEIENAITKIVNILFDGFDLVNTGIDAILDLINDLEKKALDMGVDIAMCVVDQKVLVEDLRVDTINNLNNTANRIINGINEIKTKAVDTIDGYLGVVQELLDDFNDCSIINVICLTKVLAKATATSIKLTAELPALAIDIIKTVGEAVIGGTADMAKITSDFTTTTARITYEITSCVAELMPIK